jgi:energy-coupling factor transporter ATP-binding protein EcfA2
MKILDYKYTDLPYSGWKFSKISLGKINLLVGNTGSGKTRFMNTIFNIGSSVVNGSTDIPTGRWEIDFLLQEVHYFWMIETAPFEKNRTKVIAESLEIINIGESKNQIFERNSEKFIFKGSLLPKLSPNQSGLFILKDEEVINPIWKGFGQILRRHFSMDALIRATEYGAIASGFIESNKKITLEEIINNNFPLNLNLYFLSRNFPDKFEKICNYYKSFFPFISDILINDLHILNNDVGIPDKIPVFCIKEKGSSEWIQLNELSSGMQKVLLIISDFFLLPSEGIYLIDEYENSLGINAIDFFPTFLKEQESSNQFIITSHHPYLITNIPTKNWFVFHRDKKNVEIMFGNEIIQKYGKSKQDAFTQLINDPYYYKGIE